MVEKLQKKSPHEWLKQNSSNLHAVIITEKIYQST